MNKQAVHKLATKLARHMIASDKYDKTEKNIAQEVLDLLVADVKATKK